jgi:hypothetical protein
MLRCASSFVVAAYAKVRLTPHDLRALPAELFLRSRHFCRLSHLRQGLDIIYYMIEGPDVHGPLLFLLAEFRIEEIFDFQEQFDGVDTIKLMNFPEIVIHPGIFDLKLFPEKIKDFYFNLSSRHLKSPVQIIVFRPGMPSKAGRF